MQVGSHRSKEREERAKRYQSNDQGRLIWSGGIIEEDPTTPAGQLGRTSAGLEKRCSALSPKTPPTESGAKERQCVRYHRSKERREHQYRQET